SGAHSAADSSALAADRATASASASASATATVTPVAPRALAAPTTGSRPTAVSKAATSPKSLSGNGSLAGKVIVIEPGHNGGNFTHPAQINRLVDAGFGQRKACNTTGTSTNAGYTEAAYTFDVAKRLP